MYKRFGSFGTALLFAFALTAAPVGIDTSGDTLSLKGKTAEAAKGGNKGGKSSSKGGSKGGKSSGKGGGKSGGGSASSSAGGGNGNGHGAGGVANGQGVGDTDEAGSKKKVFTDAEGNERAHPSALGRLNAWLNASSTALENAAENSTVGLARLYQELTTGALDAESDIADAQQALDDANLALSEAELALNDTIASEAENIALAEADLSAAQTEADAAQTAYDEAVAEAIALQQAFDDSKFADSQEEADALAELNTAIDSLNISELESDLNGANQAVADAEAALDDANSAVTEAEAAVEDANTAVSEAETDLAEAETLAETLSAEADATLEQAANKEVTDEVRETVDNHFGFNEEYELASE